MSDGRVAKGRRPVVVVQNDIANKYSNTVIVSPISTKRSNTKLPTNIILSDGYRVINKSVPVVMLEQLITVDKHRLYEYIDHINVKDMEAIDNALCISLGIYDI
nr:type II toxin-antitoxin system PemK/MazF family toxin [[Clostridium] dakarense]